MIDKTEASSKGRFHVRTYLEDVYGYAENGIYIWVWTKINGK